MLGSDLVLVEFILNIKRINLSNDAAQRIVASFGLIPTHHSVIATGLLGLGCVWSRVGMYEIIKNLLLNLWSLFFEREEANDKRRTNQTVGAGLGE